MIHLRICLAALFIAVYVLSARAQDYPNCAGWIPHGCCCTASCCHEVEPGEVKHLGGDRWQIVPSGEVVTQKGWSRDGRFIRCACDPVEGRWLKHPAAKTHCLFPPIPNS
jgi:hypothetical protein